MSTKWQLACMFAASGTDEPIKIHLESKDGIVVDLTMPPSMAGAILRDPNNLDAHLDDPHARDAVLLIPIKVTESNLKSAVPHE